MESKFRVAVITPYFKTRPEWLAQCHESVRSQTHPCVHIMVADGAPEPAVAQWDAQHIVLSKNHNDFGDTPRAVGSMSAIGQGFDAIAYLDPDNWYGQDHIESLVALHVQTKAAVCTSSRNLNRLDGSRLGVCLESDGENFVDTNCLSLMGPARQMGAAWAQIPAGLHPIADRIMWHWIRKGGFPRAHTGRATVFYRTAYMGHYARFSEPPPAGAKTGEDTRVALETARRMGFGNLAERALQATRG